MEFQEKLFQALKNDDLQEFKSCMETNPCGSLRLGRFPVLSVMYLYNARSILRAYEKSFLRHNSWQDIGEPMELSAKFRKVAGKCLRIYLNETVSPVEMLLILDRSAKLKRVFPATNMTVPAKQRLVEIYYVRWGLKAEIVGGKIVLERRPMTHKEKVNLLTLVTCAVLCVAIVVGTPFVVNAFVPFIKDGSGALNVAKWEQIRFDSDKTYALKNDVVLADDFFAEDMNCTIIGRGHTVTVSGRGVFGNVNGTISDVVFQTDGTAIAENISGTVEKVTVNAQVNMETDSQCGFFATSNSGTIRDVVVNVSGTLSATATEDSGSYVCGGIVAVNNPTEQGVFADTGLQNCTVNYNNFTLKGQLVADAAFGGIVGQNNSLVENCKTTGTISADTFDIGGICAENNYAILESQNEANIDQRTDVTGWNPLVAGIVLNNYYAVDGCENYGNITCVATAAGVATGNSTTAYATGIAYQNVNGSVTAYLQNCVNNGTVSASATYIDASAAGVCNFTNGATRTCINNGNISAKGANFVEIAGIAGFAYGYVYRSANTGTISAESSNEARVGGIVATSSVQTSECLSTGKIEVTGKKCYVGGILGYSSGVTSNMSVYFGTAESCVASCEIAVTDTLGAGSAVGGIVGFVEEMEVTVLGADKSTYVGGEVFYCYFTGKLQTTSGVYVGGIAGAVGKNIYLLSAQENSHEYFYKNMYVDDCGVAVAFGRVFVGNVFETVEDVGVQRTALAQIEANKTYQSILQNFGVK